MINMETKSGDYNKTCYCDLYPNIRNWNDTLRLIYLLTADNGVAKYVATYIYDDICMRESVVWSVQMIKYITLFYFSRIVSHNIVYSSSVPWNKCRDFKMFSHPKYQLNQDIK